MKLSGKILACLSVCFLFAGTACGNGGQSGGREESGGTETGYREIGRAHV